MMPSASSLRNDAVQIWRAGVDAVDSTQLVANHVSVSGSPFTVCGQRIDVTDDSRICVVGAGKAGAGMALGIEQKLLNDFRDHLSGWINVPADCVPQNESESTTAIHLHAARPAGVNEPTEEGIFGTQEILNRVRDLGEQDTCIVLISGGGSALLPAPIDGITLADKQQVTRFMSASGVPIHEMNIVRSALSDVKGGGLLRACRAGRMVTLIISDVIGDPLETIASGPTIPMNPDPKLAIQILRSCSNDWTTQIPGNVFETLERLREHNDDLTEDEFRSRVYSHHLIGNNQTAVNGAMRRAEQLGYGIVLSEYDQAGIACDFGRDFAEKCLDAKSKASAKRPVCLISGGEPTVNLSSTAKPGKGGRNQELILAATERLWDEDLTGMAIFSGGTDGEDGPTDAAGAVLDAEVINSARAAGIEPSTFLTSHNAYPFFDQTNGLIRIGPTHTNVMDLRVAVIQ